VEFLLKSLTAAGHEVILVDGNAKPMNEQQLVRYAQEEGIGLVGIGAMTRMIAKAYRMGDALRAAGIQVVMGGPYVTELPDEALGRDGGPRHADAVALGEGFFGDSIRFRSNESVVNELLLLKRRARQERGQVSVFFIDDNFAINVKRTKSLLRDIIAADAQLPWTTQISANLLRDEELVDLIAASGGKWIFIGMESIDPENLADVNQSFNKPDECAGVLRRLAERNIYAITSFIIGLDNDTPGVAERTMKQIESRPPGMPVFGPLTPLPGTPLFARLGAEGRLTRPKHWLDFALYRMAHTPLKMTIPEAQQELETAWRTSYSPKRNEEVIDLLAGRGIDARIMHL
jgi:radical SAM superfamily enzyme YgiQ (UPF0313 family)